MYDATSTAPAVPVTAPTHRFLDPCWAFQATALAWFAAWMPKAVTTVTTTSAPVLASAQSSIATFGDEAEASYEAVKTHRSTWLFIGLVLLATLVTGFVGGHWIGTRGANTLKTKITDLQAVNSAQTLSLTESANALGQAYLDLKKARDTIEALTPPPKVPTDAVATEAPPAPKGKKRKHG